MVVEVYKSGHFVSNYRFVESLEKKSIISDNTVPKFPHRQKLSNTTVFKQRGCILCCHTSHHSPLSSQSDLFIMVLRLFILRE